MCSGTRRSPRTACRSPATWRTPWAGRARLRCSLSSPGASRRATPCCAAPATASFRRTRRCTSPRRTRGTAAAGHSYRCPRPPSAPRYARGKTPSAPGHGRTSSGTTCWGSAGLAPGRAEAARAARARRELLHDLQLHLRHRNHDELRDAIHRLHGENLLAAVPERDHERSLIVRVDEADQVPEHDAAFRSEAGARQDERRVARVADVDRDAGGDQLALAGLERHFLLDARAQVESGGTGAGIVRQQAADPLVEDLDLERPHLRRASPWAMRSTSLRASSSFGPRPSGCRPRASNSVMSFSSEPRACCARFATISGTFFFSRLALACFSSSWLSAAKPTQKGGLGSAATQARMSGFSTSSSDTGL